MAHMWYLHNIISLYKGLVECIAVVLFSLLIMAGDIEINPGPGNCESRVMVIFYVGKFLLASFKG